MKSFYKEEKLRERIPGIATMVTNTTPEYPTFVIK